MLCRLWIRSSLLDELGDDEFRMHIYEKISLNEDTNRILDYLNADFTQIYDDVIRHLSLR